MILRHTEYRVSFFKDETKNGCRKKIHNFGRDFTYSNPRVTRFIRGESHPTLKPKISPLFLMIRGNI